MRDTATEEYHVEPVSSKTLLPGDRRLFLDDNGKRAVRVCRDVACRYLGVGPHQLQKRYVGSREVIATGPRLKRQYDVASLIRAWEVRKLRRSAAGWLEEMREVACLGSATDMVRLLRRARDEGGVPADALLHDLELDVRWRVIQKLARRPDVLAKLIANRASA